MAMLRISKCLTAVLLILGALLFSESVGYSADGEIVSLLKPVEGTIEQAFGFEYNTVLQREQMNMGVSFRVEGRQPVFATADGTLQYRRTGRDKVHLIIRHSRGYESHYVNLAEALHDSGSEVRKGDVIGFVNGKEGESLLYYEFQFRGNAIDPLPFFEKEGEIS